MDKDKIDKVDGQQAYQTLVDWVKAVPNMLEEIEKNGTEDELRNYKLQIKMVVDKLKEIEKSMEVLHEQSDSIKSLMEDIEKNPKKYIKHVL